MKTQHLSLMAAVLASSQGLFAATINLPASAALPAGTSTTRGFTVRTVQGPDQPTLANNSIRAVQQLNGTLRDAAGLPVPNEAIPPDGGATSFTSDTINFELNGTDVNVVDGLNTVVAIWPSQLFPGIPGTGGHARNFALEAVGFLELPAGSTTFGISVTAERTDSNDDDGYLLTVGTNPRDSFNVKLADYERTAPSGFNTFRIENQVTVVAPVAGIYPVRLLFWQTGANANLHFYSVISELERVLVNDTTTDPRAIKSYTDTSVAAAKGPYLGEYGPTAGSAGINPADPIRGLIIDGASTVATTDVKLFLNDAAVTPQTLSKANGQITFSYTPNASRTTVQNNVRLEYADSTGAKYTNTWSFEINVAGGSTTTVAGQWDFDGGTLAATVGNPLTYTDPTFDDGPGSSGTAPDETQFGTTTTFGIPDINGQPAKVVRVPGLLDRRIGYVMNHGIAPNGGGTKVNQYTLIYDIYVETTGPGAASLLQTDSVGSDGDLFWQGNQFGQGGGGYNGRGTFTAGAWHRVIAAYDEAATPPVVTKFVDGIKQDDWTANQSLDNTRRALGPTAILFHDGDQDERRVMYVNSVQIRAGKISDAEAVALGGPSARGIPQSIPVSTARGQWDFNFGDLGPSMGKALTYTDPTFDNGPAADGAAAEETQFGTTTSFGIPDIGGVEAQVVRVPGLLDRRIGYVMDHGIAPNGGGTKVNQYTLIYDIYVETTGPGAASLLQTDSTGSDGDLFWQGNNFGQGGGGYNGRGTFTAGAWHRVVAAYDMAATPPVVTKYVDGIKQDDWTANQSLDNARRALGTTAILFHDGDQDERRVMYVNSVQIRVGKISDAEAVLLGGPSAAGIPAVIPATNVRGLWDFEFGDLGASVGKALAYVDPTYDDGPGAAQVAPEETQFGTTTSFGIPDIGGAEAKVVRVPGLLDRRIGYIMDHGIAPNGGGTKVNQYTLLLDIYVETTGPGAASLWQTDSVGSDGDLFWQGNNFGQGGGGYNGLGTFTAGAWHRVIAAYNEAGSPPVVTKFVDGIKQDDWTANQGLDNPRRALGPTAILFHDGDQDERRVMYVSSVQIRSGKLTDAEMAALGGPSAGGIPILIPAVPKLSVSYGGGSVTISWPDEVTGFKLERTSNLETPVWTEVTDRIGNSATLPSTGNGFFRLVQ